MKKIILLFSLVLVCIQVQGQNFESTNNVSKETKDKKSNQMSIHDFEVTDIDGNPFNFARYKGNKILIVNTASECGYTPQYAELEELYKTYKSKGLIVVAFPTNDFGGQEPGTNQKIAQFCSSKYKVTFPIMSKISVTSKTKHAVYQFLTSKEKNGLEDNEVKWNFQKYLINENGALDKIIPPDVSPLDNEIVSWIKS